MTGDGGALELAVDVAHQVARGEPVDHELAERVARVFGTDAGTAVGRYALVGDGASSIVVAGAAPVPREEVELRRRAASSHPGWSLLGRPDAPAAVRLSDLVSPRVFWTTEAYQVFHAPEGGRYPANAVLARHRGELVFLALQRRARDFTDTEMDRLGVVQRLVAAACAFRSALDEATAQLQQRAGEGPVGPDYRPTRREGEVLALAAQGWTNRRIASALGITERTVRKHLSAVYDKSTTHSRAAATAWWERRRLR